eukprot:GSChrysophyteH1.ASY1.ANO1.526.1 assembled CDS
MAFLDALAGFLAAMGAVYTSGAIQQLLNQSLIPFTMLAGWAFLDRKPQLRQVIGAVVIFLGAGVVLLPHILNVSSVATSAEGDSIDSSGTARRHTHLMTLVASFVYASSNIPMSASYTYKEHGFKNLKVHVIYLTQWVSIYQLGWGFLLLPLQTIPGLGSNDGLTMRQSLQSLQNGWRCFCHEDHTCAENKAMWLLTAYIIVNFAFNLMGLYLVKHGSSVLNAISYAIILPLTVISFTLPVLGQYQEAFNWDTIAGLAVVLVGFFVWRSADLGDAESEEDTPQSTPSLTPKSASALSPVGDSPLAGAYAKDADGTGVSWARRSRSGSLERKPRSSSGGGGNGVPGAARRKRNRSKHLFSPKVATRRGDGRVDAPSFQERTLVLTNLTGRSPKATYSPRLSRSLPKSSVMVPSEMVPLSIDTEPEQARSLGAADCV